MKIKTLLIILTIILLLFLAVKSCTSWVKKSVSGLVTGGETEFLADVDFSDGDYAVILDDTKPYLLIDDVAILKDNQDRVKLETSWMNYLPGEGRGHYGIRLFKDNKLVASKLARKFKTFQIGNLRDHGTPVILKSVYEPKQAYDSIKTVLEKDKSVFISRETQTNAQGYEYRFRLTCPSILVAKNDTMFKKTHFGKDLANRIVHSLEGYSGFQAGDNAANSTEPAPLLVMVKDGATHFLRNAETNKTLPLTGYELHGNQLLFRCTKEFYEQVKTHDFSDAFINIGLSKDEIMTLIREKIGADSGEITADAVYHSLMTTGFSVGSLKEQKYELRYYKVMNGVESTPLP